MCAGDGDEDEDESTGVPSPPLLSGMPGECVDLFPAVFLGWLSMCLAGWLAFCLSICLSFPSHSSGLLSVCPACPFICLFVSIPSICLFLHLAGCLAGWLCSCLSPSNKDG